MQNYSIFLMNSKIKYIGLLVAWKKKCLERYYFVRSNTFVNLPLRIGRRLMVSNTRYIPSQTVLCGRQNSYYNFKGGLRKLVIRFSTHIRISNKLKINLAGRSVDRSQKSNINISSIFFKKGLFQRQSNKHGRQAQFLFSWMTSQLHDCTPV